MRPNTKTFTSNSNFPSQRQQPFRNYQSKSRASDLDRWDHSGFDQLQSEQELRWNKSQTDKVDQLAPSSSTETSDSTKKSSTSTELTQKVEEAAASSESHMLNSNPEKSQIDKTGSSKKEETTKPARKEKRPDRQLYSVRQKCNTNARTEEIKRMKEMTIQCSERLNCSVIEKREDYSPYPQAVKDVLTAFEDKEQYLHEDDKLSISNVSTAMSDPLKNWDEESYVKSEAAKERMDTTTDLSQYAPSSDTSTILFELVLETENGIINIRVNQGEEDYEAYLEDLCNTHNFEAKMRLYFKINVLQLIKDSTATLEESEKVETLLDKLLDVNYKLLMYESGYGEADESIATYIADAKKEEEVSSTVLESFVHCA